ncbi:Rossmann-like and DUF2520 domain-containing protein [Ruminococcus sp.]|uniref:Rossmann-like and DUF2520 domain-containing protein n=1 Tax=Ruminococcus sp. TaxID=41978 RepID=UPI0025EAE664|nr:Rossmann-like and DUF2520 domain-containing protein [Ruminococcus sp.]MCI6615508.1 DUF2520 domain-containing protein [Ruminococcus sp.]
MNIGIIGAGKVGVSVGRYLKDNNIQIAGFYDIDCDNAAFAAQFTNTDCFSDLEKLVKLSDTLFITTPDNVIGSVWDCIIKNNMSVQNKIVCHFSGALSSDVFTDSQSTGASVCSIHPMLAFSDKLTSYRIPANTFFALEGDETAVSALKSLFETLGNTVCRIDKSKKSLYHTAASVLSNEIVALLDMGYSLLEQCGFSRDEAVKATQNLVLGNVKSVLENGCVNALTGPVERNDLQTVKKHVDSLQGEDRQIYILLAKRLVNLAKARNKDRDYGELSEFLDLS